MQKDRKQLWNDNHKLLRQTIYKKTRFLKNIDLILQQHCQLHSSKVFPAGIWFYADEVLNDLTNSELTKIPEKFEHSIAWIYFHIARIEDITMNILVAEETQLYKRNDWQKKMNIDIIHSGNNMSDEEMSAFNTSINTLALLEYRNEVGINTRKIINKLKFQDLLSEVSARNLEIIKNEQAISNSATGVLDYWSRRDIAGLLLMPATRHNLIHLNKAVQIRARIHQN